MDNIYLSIVIPCFNEERNIRLGALEGVAHYLKKQSYSYEVIIIDDGSDDESRKLITGFIEDHPNFSIIAAKHRGKAATVMTGISRAKGKYILFTDLDQATPINQIEKLIPMFNKGFEVVIGSRKERRSGAPFTRRAMARGFMFLRNMILNLGIDDTQCGFKAFTRRAGQKIFAALKVYSTRQEARGSIVTAGFDVEILFVAKIRGFRIAEVPVEWHYQETRHVNPLRDSWDGLLALIKIRMNEIRGIY